VAFVNVPTEPELVHKIEPLEAEVPDTFNIWFSHIVTLAPAFAVGICWISIEIMLVAVCVLHAPAPVTVNVSFTLPSIISVALGV